LQFRGALYHSLFQLVVRLAKLFLLPLAHAHVRGEADHAGFFAALIEQN
jgi:hypothetical protein